MICERERIRQRLLHGLEAFAGAARATDPADAVEAAMDAIRIEPLRESAQQLLIEAHLAEGNVIEALRTYRAYARLLRRNSASARADPRRLAAVTTVCDGLVTMRRR